MKLHTIILYALLAGLAAYTIYTQQVRERQVYVDNIELFNGFKMKNELEKKYQLAESARKQVLDSLLNRINTYQVHSKEDNEILDNLKKEFMYRKNRFDQENSEAMSQYNTQIWNQLNDYVKQFGKEKKYSFVFGTNGQGNLMYADEAANVTAELTDYVNERYNGK